VDLSLSEEDSALFDAAKEFVSRECPAYDVTQWFKRGDTVRPELYEKMGSAGWLGMMAPESTGGGGSTALQAGLVFEALGEAPVPGPLASSGLIVPLLLSELGTPGQRERYMPGLCSGSDLWALGVADREAGWGSETVETEATRTANGLVLNGVKRVVHEAGDTRYLLCGARLDGRTVLAVVDLRSPGVVVRPHVGFLAGLWEVTLEDVEVESPGVLGDVERDSWSALEGVLHLAMPVLAAYYAGACKRILDFTIDYTNERMVYGQYIGRFQRVQDHVVEVANAADAAKWITYEALSEMDKAGVAVPGAAHECYAVATESYVEACNFSHMVFAGPGTDYDHPLMAHSVNARMHYTFLGGPDYHKARMMDYLYPILGSPG
jgi:alkylation response protein AidB-like acyl-CoA dehydrogenase